MANGCESGLCCESGLRRESGLRLRSLNRLTNVLASGSAAASYSFDVAGNLQTMRYGNGVTNLYQYDLLNRLTNLTSSTEVEPLPASIISLD